MKETQLREMLEALAKGKSSVEQTLENLADFPHLDLGHSRLDLQRELRSGFPEVVFAEHKNNAQLCSIIEGFLDSAGEVLVTRLTGTQVECLRSSFDQLTIVESAGIAYCQPLRKEELLGRVGILTGGTSDFRVAEEASLCSEYFGLEVTRLYDVGVAGLSRLLSVLDELRSQDALIVVAGMEGALPSVVSGLVKAPIVGVPTSVGYGASFGGVTSLLSMLSSCSPGLTVVNIDNGFGAAFAVAKMLKHLAKNRSE